MLAAMYRECLHHFHESVCQDFLLSLRNWKEHYLCRCSDEIFKGKAICCASPCPPFRKYNPMIDICLVHESDVMYTVFLQFDFIEIQFFTVPVHGVKQLCFRRSQKSVVRCCSHSFLGRGEKIA